MLNVGFFASISSLSYVLSSTSLLIMLGFILARTYSKYTLEQLNKRKLDSSHRNTEQIQETNKSSEYLEYSHRKSKLAAYNYFQKKRNAQNIYFTFIPKVIFIMSKLNNSKSNKSYNI